MAIKIKAPQEVADINVTPMVDVMLVLLIIFMVITPMLQSKVSVDLAKAQNPRLMPDEKKTDAVVISITRDGKVYLGSDVIQLDSLTKQVGDLMANKLDKTVYIKCDNRAKLGVVLSVEDAIRGAGIEQLGLITQKVEKRPPLPPLYTP